MREEGEQSVHVHNTAQTIHRQGQTRKAKQRWIENGNNIQQVQCTVGENASGEKGNAGE